MVGIRQLQPNALVFHPGDQIVLESSSGFVKRFENAPDFLAMRQIGSHRKEEIDTVKAYTSGVILLVMLICVAFSIFPLFSCALAAIFALALTGCASVQDMKKGVSLKVVLTIVGAFGLGDIPLHQMIAVLCYSVACQMLSPVSYNTNLMSYAACPEYAFTDFAKLGAPLVLIVLVVSIPLCEYFFTEG